MRKKKAKKKKKQYLDKAATFPFLQDEETFEYIKKSRVVFIMRGVAGSGKTTLAKLIKKKYKHSVHCASDDFFMQGSVYVYDRSLLKQAHEVCLEKAENALESGVTLVIIDSTNLHTWSTQRYIRLAYRFDCHVILVTPKTSWGRDKHELFRKNQHNVPLDAIEHMLDVFEDIIPLYYAWLLNSTDSDVLLQMGRQVYQECIEKLRLFRENIERSIGFEEVHDGCMIHNYYTREKFAGGSKLHCTAKFCGKGKVPGSEEYAKSDIVQQSMDRFSRLEVIGLILTPRTLTARIRLNDEQLQLWGNEDHMKNAGKDGESSLEDMMRKMSVKDRDEADRHVSKRSKKQRAAGKHTHGQGASSGKQDMRNPSSCGASTAKIRYNVTSGYGSKAHITLGCAQGVTPVQAGADLVDIISMEQAILSNCDTESVELSVGDAVYFGDGRCVVYLQDPVYFDSIFGGYY